MRRKEEEGKRRYPEFVDGLNDVRGQLVCISNPFIGYVLHFSFFPSWIGMVIFFVSFSFTIIFIPIISSNSKICKFLKRRDFFTALWSFNS